MPVLVFSHIYYPSYFVSLPSYHVTRVKRVCLENFSKVERPAYGRNAGRSTVIYGADHSGMSPIAEVEAEKTGSLPGLNVVGQTSLPRIRAVVRGDLDFPSEPAWMLLGIGRRDHSCDLAG